VEEEKKYLNRLRTRLLRNVRLLDVVETPIFPF